MTLFLHIALLELKRYLTNRGELAFGLALPIVLFGLTYAVFGGGTSFHATANIVDLDGGPGARELVRRLDALDPITVRERTLESADAALDRSAILAAFIIPVGFSEALEAGESVSLTFKRRGNGGEEGQIVAGIVRSVAQEVGRQGRVRRLAMAALEGSGVTPSLIDEQTAPLIADSWDNPPVGVDVQYLEGEEANFLHRVVPGILVMFLMFTITLGSQTLVEERRLGTLERLMTTRLSATQLFLGKFSAHVLRGSVQSLILLVPAFALLRVGGSGRIRAGCTDLRVSGCVSERPCHGDNLAGEDARSGVLECGVHNHVHDHIRRDVLRRRRRSVGGTVSIHAEPLRHRVDGGYSGTWAEPG